MGKWQGEMKEKVSNWGDGQIRKEGISGWEDGKMKGRKEGMKI